MHIINETLNIHPRWSIFFSFWGEGVWGWNFLIMFLVMFLGCQDGISNRSWKEWAYGLKYNFFCHGTPWSKEYCIGPCGKLHKIPFERAMDILQILLMSCPMPCMVLSWALSNKTPWLVHHKTCDDKVLNTCDYMYNCPHFNLGDLL